jgi:hypothetical protein
MPKVVNTITGIQGNKGDGKTTLATLLLYSNYVEQLKKNMYCNYKLSFPFLWLNASDMLSNPLLFNDSIVCIDELHDYADSRNSSSFQNIYISAWFLQSRHSETDIIYTTQFYDQIDKRINRITDVNIVIKNLYVDSDNDGDDDMFSFFGYDRRYNIDIPVKTFYAKPIFDLFDSSYRINPFLISKEKKKELFKKIELLNDEITKQHLTE